MRQASMQRDVPSVREPLDQKNGDRLPQRNPRRHGEPLDQHIRRDGTVIPQHLVQRHRNEHDAEADGEKNRRTAKHLNNLLNLGFREIQEISVQAPPDTGQPRFIRRTLQGELNDERNLAQFPGTPHQVVGKILIQIASNVRRTLVEVVVQIFDPLGGNVNDDVAFTILLVTA